MEDFEPYTPDDFQCQVEVMLLSKDGTLNRALADVNISFQLHEIEDNPYLPKTFKVVLPPLGYDYLYIDTVYNWIVIDGVSLYTADLPDELNIEGYVIADIRNVSQLSRNVLETTIYEKGLPPKGYPFDDVFYTSGNKQRTIGYSEV